MYLIYFFYLTYNKHIVYNTIYLMQAYVKLSSIISGSFLLLSVSLHAQEFGYLFEPDSKYQIISEVKQQIYRNDAFSHDAYFRNIVNVDIIGGDREVAVLHARYRVTERAEFNERVNTVQNEYQITYRLNNEGVIVGIDEDAFLPMVRNVPRFPRGKVEIGDTWSFVLEEVFDFRAQFGVKRPFKISTIANYEYIGATTSQYDQRSYPTIKISYPIKAHRRVWGKAGGLTISVSGSTEQVLLWDDRRGRPHSYSEEYQFGWQAGYLKAEFTGTAEAYTVELSDTIDQTRKAELEKAVEQGQLSDISVEVDDEGVVVGIGELRFQPNTAILLPGEGGEERIIELAELIRGYDSGQVLVIGHTALAGTAAGRQRLSELRARTIADLLQKHNVENLLIQGMGGTQPIADNSTEEGRMQNRRVEVKLIGKRGGRAKRGE